MTARETALRALLRVEEEAGYSNLVLNRALQQDKLRGPERSLSAALFYGVLERRLTLDAALRPYLAHPNRRMDPAVREILRMAVYQIYFMEKIPDSAAVNEAVRLAKKAGKTSAASFINAVLRHLLREKGAVPFPPRDSDPLRQLSVAYSCPVWLLQHWIQAYGKSITLEMLEASFARPPLYAAVNSLRTDRDALRALLQQEGIRAEPVPALETALTLKQTGAVTESAAFRQGLFHIQDLASQLCCRFLGAQPGERVYDVCAAPGGKAFTTAQRMHNRGTLLAFDQSQAKVGLIEQGAHRLGIICLSAAVRDAADPNAAPLPPADRVLCDVPCSGLGVLRRKPEIRYKSAESIDSLPDLQYRILCRSAALLRVGGTLLYSTCTLNPAENGENAARFLREHPEFSPVPLQLPGEIRRTIAEPENQLTLFPQTNGTDGFFLCLFRKEA